MQRRSRSRSTVDMSPPLPDSDGRRLELVEEILAVLHRHQSEPDEGVQALLVAFLHSASRALDASSEETLDDNRDTLLTLLEQAKGVLAERPSSPTS